MTTTSEWMLESLLRMISIVIPPKPTNNPVRFHFYSLSAFAAMTCVLEHGNFIVNANIAK